jgi:hypothetical protein
MPDIISRRGVSMAPSASTMLVVALTSCVRPSLRYVTETQRPFSMPSPIASASVRIVSRSLPRIGQR